MRFRVIISLLLLGGVVSGCDRRVEARLDEAAAIVAERPDSALRILESVDRHDIFTRRVAARHALLYSQALDKNYIDVDRDTLIRVATDYFRFNGTDHDRAMAYYYLGSVYDNAGRSIEAIIELKQAERYAYTTDDNHLKGLVASCIGSLYLQTYNYDDASAWYTSAVGFFAASASLHNEAIATEMLATSEYRRRRHAEALDLRRRALELYRRVDDAASAERLEHDILASRFAAGESVEVIKREFLRFATEHYGARLTPESAGFWTNIYRESGQTDSARICAEYRLRTANRNDAYDVAGCYARLSDIEKRAGNFKRAFDYLDSAERLTDSLGSIAATNDILELEKELTSQRLGDEVELLAARSRLQWVTIVLILLLAGCLLLYFRHRYRLMRRRQANVEAELHTINQTYRHLVDRHEELKQQIDTRDEGERQLFQAIEGRLSSLRSLMESAHGIKPSRFVDEFRNHMGVNPRAENALDDLQFVVNRKYYGIIDFLKEHYPGLNTQDLDLCALLSFGFSQTGICYVYGYSDIGAFYNKRSRLRKKMNLPEDYGIEDFIQNTIASLRERASSQE